MPNAKRVPRGSRMSAGGSRPGKLSFLASPRQLEKTVTGETGRDKHNPTMI